MEFRNRYPHIFPRYATVCDRQLFQPGSLMLFKEPGHWILLFPTKVHWKDLAELEYVESGLAAFRRTYAEKGDHFRRVPEAVMRTRRVGLERCEEKYLGDLSIAVEVYE